MTLKLVLLTKPLSAKAAFKFMDLVVKNLDVLLQVGVAVEGRRAKLACIAVFVTLCVMLKNKVEGGIFF